ncbi:MAG: DUF4282 domain-containing protein [Pseudomonadota bacterium]
MGIFSGFLSFEKPMSETLTRLLYYLGILGIIWTAISRFWFWLTYIDNDWDTALWGMIRVPIIAIITLLILRVLAEYVLAHFRMEKSLHDLVTGRAAPPPKL